MEATVNQTVANEVMDARIVKLNEIIGVRLASVNSKKRPAVKEARELAKYILNNWDNEFELANIKSEDVKNDSIQNILSSRLQNFADAKKACDKAVQETEETKAEVKLTDKEQAALEFFVKASEGEEGFAMEEVENIAEEVAGINMKSLKGIASSLQKKGMLDMYNGGAYYDGAVTEFGMETYKRLASESTAEAPKKEKKEKVNKEDKSTKGAGHKVGDVHKNGKWVWTEYQPGKFDWRTIPSKKQKTGAKPKNSDEKKETKKADKNAEAKKSAKTSKGNAKPSKKAEPKKESPEATKQLTIDEWVALPTKSARNNKKMNDSQKQAFKLIMKGYRVTSDKKFFENSEGDKKACNWASVEAMFKRYGINYIPEGLVK